jgi:hypothetical protein
MIPSIETRLHSSGPDALYTQMKQEPGEHIRDVPLIVNPILKQDPNILAYGLRFPDTISVFTELAEDVPDHVELSTINDPRFFGFFKIKFSLFRNEKEVTHALLPETTIQSTLGADRSIALQHSSNDSYIFEDGPTVTVNPHFELAKDTLPLPNIFLIQTGDEIYLTNIRNTETSKQRQNETPFTRSGVIYRDPDPQVITHRRPTREDRERARLREEERMQEKLRVLSHKRGNAGKKTRDETKFLRGQLGRNRRKTSRKSPR